MNVKRLFFPQESVEDMSCVYEILQYAKEHHGKEIAYRQLESRTEEKTITFYELAEQVDCLRAALMHHGFSGKHVAVLGETSIEWITIYLALVSGVGVCVPIDRELSIPTMIKQLNHSDAEYIFTSSKGIKKLEKVLPECPKVHKISIMRGKLKDNAVDFAGNGSFSELIEEGRRLMLEKGDTILPKINPDKMCLIIYTSGTTGANKGVMLSNRNIMGTLRGCARLLRYPKTSFSVLPINHSYELHAHLMSSLYCGTTVCLNDDLKHLLKNFKYFAPEMSCMVPMMLELIVKKLKKEIEDSGKTAKFNRMVAISNVARKAGIDIRDRVFRQIKESLGGNLKMIICGGAALSQTTIDFLDSIGIKVYNGYGITECSPVAAVNTSRKCKPFSVGCVLPTAEIRIAEPDENGNGEIQVFGDNIMQGYYKAPEDTKSVFTEDGWLKTGDLGRKDKDNFVYLSGRLKNLIILPNGKNISPEEVEEMLEKHIPYIKECVVLPNKEETGLYAVIYLDQDFCKEHNLNTLEEMKTHLHNDIHLFNRDVPSFKRISDYEVTDKEFEKSTTHKIQRFKIKTAYDTENPNPS